jgi:hypothetical protein
MRPDSALLAALAGIRDRLLDPTPANLEVFTVELEEWVRKFDDVVTLGIHAEAAVHLTRLSKQIQALHRQVAALRFGAARAATAEAAGYTPLGRPGMTGARSNLAISG